MNQNRTIEFCYIWLGIAELEKSPFEEIAKEPTRDITFQEHECQASSGEENDHPVAGTLEAVSVHDVPHQRVQVVDLTDWATDRLIGTSKQRKEIMDQLKKEYEALLEEDKKKELEKEKNVQTEALRRSRQNCVPSNPWGHQRGLSSGLQDHGSV